MSTAAPLPRAFDRRGQCRLAANIAAPQATLVGTVIPGFGFVIFDKDD
jgi:hypothetical protein